ncbi:glycoside hydrolase domain-containing protein [Enterococcus sp. DIV0086]|uniref:glycoside hydrolase domain-containing protein n=1 Tax=Enterococcus sp. DIV0086 TaxID=2774655 RepID=UPI003D2E6B04
MTEELLNRFEGFNNETDMESPLCYTFARQDIKSDQIFRLWMNCIFSNAKGGLCSNNDSGGLTLLVACTILGLFPVTDTFFLNY